MYEKIKAPGLLLANLYFFFKVSLKIVGFEN